MAELKSDNERHIHTDTLTLGRKVSQFASRLKEVKVIGSYEKLPDQLTGLEIKAILNEAIDRFVGLECDVVDLDLTRFHSPINQEVVVERLLPCRSGQSGVITNRFQGDQRESFRAVV